MSRTDQSFDEYQRVYEQTQNLICTSRKLDVKAGRFQIELKVPEDCSGACYVRGMLITEDGVFLGSKPVSIKR